jgi:integrase/recombinase XerC
MNTISQSIDEYIRNITAARSNNTARTYRNALNFFGIILKQKGIVIDQAPPTALSEEFVSWLAMALKDFSPATERLYLTAVAGFYEYLSAEKLSDINLPRMRMLIRQRARRPGQRLPQFPYNNIEYIIDYVNNIAFLDGRSPVERLRILRDRAFLLTLADTGLRVHEACNLRRGDIDWNEGKALVIGKGDRQAVIRFSSRSLSALRDYLSSRSATDGASGRPLTSLPIFARHDRGAGNKVKPITTATGRNIVIQRVKEALGAEAVGTITPHSFRHYFVTVVLRSSGNLKLAQELARHRNISVTQRYAHLSDDELDEGYWDIFKDR